jgi:uncharacterized protein YigE (DUF2233 family)
MKRAALGLVVLLVGVALTIGWLITRDRPDNETQFICYVADAKRQDVQLYWKDDENKIFRSIQNLKTWLEKGGKHLVFAMNAGMYKIDNAPQGLLIIKNATLSKLDTLSGKGNFYLQPNGVFYITNGGIAGICRSREFVNDGRIKYATQSGPMLVVAGNINPAFKENSANLNIRNGVGLLPYNKVVFAMSRKEMNFYEFASYFKRLGCQNALYLDGYVSRMYLPEKQWAQTDGDFGAIIGVTASRP